MPNQHTPAEPTIPTAAANYKLVAVTSAVVLVGSIVVDLCTTLDVPRGVSALLAALTAIGGYGYLIRSGQSAIVARIAELERKLDERRGPVPLRQDSRPRMSLVPGGVGIDPDSIAAARKIARDLLKGS